MLQRFLTWLAAVLGVWSVTRAEDPLAISVYATAGDVLRHLAPLGERTNTIAVLQPLRVSRLFLEGRRGDEYAPPQTMREVRDFLEARGIRCSGGIATVPGTRFGSRQNAELGWLNWESEKTRRDVSGFFTENAPLFDELIVDDFYCTADTSPESERARGQRSWGEYRRELLVSLIEPIILRPAREANPAIRLILKYPQWYDRFHLFGYDPARMSVPFDSIWVGTEVRDPATRRMGFVQPTEGYMNFRWLTSVAGEKVVGSWFDHIECSAQHFVDQAYQSVLAGARELTLFRLGDLIEKHPGDALLAAKLPDLVNLAMKVRGHRRDGIAFYKPPGSSSDDNLYLMDYLGMLGLPILPESKFPEAARVVFLGVQAAADRGVVAQARWHLERGNTLVVTPAFLRAAGRPAGELAAATVRGELSPAAASLVRTGNREWSLSSPLDIDGSLEVPEGDVRLTAIAEGRPIPLLAERSYGGGRVVVLNVRTFSEQDFRDAGEWLLAPKALGLSELPEGVLDVLRGILLRPFDVEFGTRAGVGLYLFERDRCLYNFHDVDVRVRLDGSALNLPAKSWVWEERP